MNLKAGRRLADPKKSVSICVHLWLNFFRRPVPGTRGHGCPRSVSETNLRVEKFLNYFPVVLLCVRPGQGRADAVPQNGNRRVFFETSLGRE